MSIRALIILMLSLVFLPLSLSAETPVANSTLNPKVYQLGLSAYNNAVKDGIKVKNPLLTIVDFSLPSDKKRLWVINPKTNSVLMHLYVAQGHNTGLYNARHFSNTPGSLESSLGLYLTGNTFHGHDGYSLRLYGLEKGFNSHALSRGIIVHGAWYVSKGFISEYHRLGRSYGCLAVDLSQAHPFINTIKNGSLIFSYYPNPDWLEESTFLNP